MKTIGIVQAFLLDIFRKGKCWLKCNDQIVVTVYDWVIFIHNGLCPLF